MKRLAAIVVLGYALAISACGFGGTSSESPSPSKGSPTPASLSPNMPPSPQPPAEVSRLFSVQKWARGESLWLGVGDIPRVDGDCFVHSFTVGGRTRGAYQSDCRSWETTDGGYDIVLFYVALKNPTGRPINFNLRNFLLVSRQNRASYPPVNVRSEAEHPPLFLPEIGIIAPRSNLVGYLTFDGRAEIVPQRLSYIAAHQVLTMRFDGRHTVRIP